MTPLNKRKETPLLLSFEPRNRDAFDNILLEEGKEKQGRDGCQKIGSHNLIDREP